MRFLCRPCALLSLRNFSPYGCGYDLGHLGVRFAAEAALLASGEGRSEFDQPMRRLGNGQQIVVDLAGDGIVLDEEALFAAFDMHGGSSVAEAEAVGLVDDVENPAVVDRPEAEGVGLDGDDFSGLDGYLGIGNTDPAEIEMLPAAEGCAGCLKGLASVADLSAHVAADKAVRHMQVFGAVLGLKRDAIAAGHCTGDFEVMADRGLSRLAQREHVASVCHGSALQ